MNLYNFNTGQMGLTFLSVATGTALVIITYFSYLYFILEPDIEINGFGPPEQRLLPALYASFFPSIGLFLFGWAAKRQLVLDRQRRWYRGLCLWHLHPPAVYFPLRTIVLPAACGQSFRKK